MKPKNILIINTFGIGDVLFSTPLISAIKSNLPSAKIHYICNQRNVELMENNPDIVSVLVFEKDDFRNVFRESKIKFIKKLVKFIRNIKALNIDTAIDLTLNYQMSLLLTIAGVKMRLGYDYKNRGKFLTHKIPLSGFSDKHVALYYLDLLKYLGLDISGKHELRSYVPKEEEKMSEKFLKQNNFTGKRLIGIAAGGGKSWGPDAIYRRWRVDNFIYVGKKLSEMDNVGIVILGTGEEQEICDKIQEEIGKNALSLCGKTDINCLLAIIKKCKVVLCNEGGILHISVSLGVNTASLFGPVDDKVYGPFPISESHKVIFAEGVKCRPCYRNFKHDLCDAQNCLNGIDKDRVLNITRELLEKTS